MKCGVQRALWIMGEVNLDPELRPWYLAYTLAK